MAARWAPRAMKLTSAPACASAAPNPPPTPPAPTIAIRIVSLLVRKSAARAKRALSERCRARSCHAVQGAELVAVGIAQIGDIKLDPAAFADARRLFAGLAAMGDAGRVKRVGLFGRIGGKTDGAAIGMRRGLAVDRLRHREGPGLGPVENTIAVEPPWLDPQRPQ